ncbi:hypothetical protein IFM89_021855 [Coptis chinensis]|uniref:Uncharacterized protein n=1 Tax=Coptis chinensis TaxID=261450 RepID=A0A835I4D8_9MAGN|nr:hypothetical protein IFM89_021855 [Coptis chinensis]
MFLLCNGILVFLGLIGSSSYKTDVQGEYSYMNDVADKDIEVQRVTTLENDFLQDGSEVGNEFMIIEGPKEEETQTPREEEIRFFITDEVAYDQEGNAWTGLLATPGEQNKRLDDGYTDEEGDGLLSTEELNKKFEDFIRKMKENIITEAQQHLIMVS